MRFQELCARCGLCACEVEYYKQKGLFGADFGADTELTCAQLNLWGSIAFFRKAGLSKEKTAEYLSACRIPEKREVCIRILTELRRELSDCMHEKGEMLDKVDYLLFKLRAKKQEF